MIVPQVKKQIVGEDRYIYQFVGKYKSIDWDNRVMQLTGSDGKEYVFRLRFDQQGLPSNIFTLNYENTDYRINDTEPQVLTIDRGSDGDPISPFQSGDTILLTWDDIRTLADIKRDLANDSEGTLNKNSPTMVAQRIQRLVGGR